MKTVCVRLVISATLLNSLSKNETKYISMHWTSLACFNIINSLLLSHLGQADYCYLHISKLYSINETKKKRKRKNDVPQWNSPKCQLCCSVVREYWIYERKCDWNLLKHKNIVAWKSIVMGFPEFLCVFRTSTLFPQLFLSQSGSVIPKSQFIQETNIGNNTWHTISQRIRFEFYVSGAAIWTVYKINVGFFQPMLIRTTDGSNEILK